MEIQYAYCTFSGDRKYNEDSVKAVETEKGYCFLVADGLGGHGGGEQASQMAAQVICRSWDSRADKDMLTGLIRKANEAVLAIQTPACAMKTTAVVLTVEDNKAVWAHVGDSRLYHFYNGKLVFQTKDHSVAQMGVLLGDITPDEIRFHPDRSRVLRALDRMESSRWMRRSVSWKKESMRSCSAQTGSGNTFWSRRWRPT